VFHSKLKSAENLALHEFEFPKSNAMLIHSCYVSKQFKKPRDNSYSKKSSKTSDIRSESEDNDDTGPLLRFDSTYVNMNKTPDIYLRD
jgi:hypothetical protein